MTSAVLSKVLLLEWLDIMFDRKEFMACLYSKNYLNCEFLLVIVQYFRLQ